MARFKDSPDEVKDFSLLVTNQLIIALIMNDIPVIDFKVEVFTKELLEKHKLACRSTTNFKVGDGRIFKLGVKIMEVEDEFSSDFKMVVTLVFPVGYIVPEGTLTDEDIEKFQLETAPIPGRVLEYEGEKTTPIIGSIGSEEKVFLFVPTMSQGEAVVNETFLWLKEQIAKKISGVN